MGVLVKAPVERVREILASFGEDLVFRTNDGWTAAFYMEIEDTADDEAAERLRSRGFVPVYRFDFSKYEFLTWPWDGERWNLLETESSYVDPDTILGDVDLKAPYWDGPVPKSEPLISREALVIEGASVEQARTLAGDRWSIEPGPMGAIVYGPDDRTRNLRINIMFNETRFAFWDHAPGRVLEVEFYPKLGNFWFRVMKGEECLGTFRPGDTRTWDGTPFLASVEDETEPEAIVEKLGISRSFLAGGLKEAGAMAVDAVVVGVNAVGKATGIGSFEYHPISTFGQAAQASGAGPAVVQLVNGFADGWSDAIERARHGDYRSLVDVSTDTLLMIDGAHSGGMAVIDQGEAIAARLGGIAKAARGIAGRLPAEAADIAMAMAQGADAFVAELRAGGMQMATAGGGPGPGIGGITSETLAKAARAGGRAFTDERLSRSKPRAIKTIQQRLGTAKAPDVAEWISRVEAVFDGDSKAALRFLNKLTARVTEPAPFLRKVDILLAVRNIAADDFAAVLSSILDAKISDPVAVLDDIEWISTRPLSAQARSTLIRRAAKGQVDLDWVKRTRLTDRELEIMGQEKDMSFVEFEQASDIPSRRHPGHLVDRPPPNHGASANGKIRGIAGELAARDMTLPGGLKIERRMLAGNTEPTADFELRAPDGSVAELEAKALRPEKWKRALDEYDEGIKNSNVDPKNPVARLLKQVKAGFDRGHKVYVAVSDGISMRSRGRLLEYLDAVGVRKEQLLLLQESEILRVGKGLREHMGIPQPTFPSKGSD